MATKCETLLIVQTPAKRQAAAVRPALACACCLWWIHWWANERRAAPVAASQLEFGGQHAALLCVPKK